MKKGLLLAALAALMITPAAALAHGGPGKGGHHGHGPGRHGHSRVYVLRGTLSNYTPYNNSIYGPQDGSITITVKCVNHHHGHHGGSLKGQVLTFAVDANTKVSLPSGSSTITDGDKGIVLVKAPKHIPPADLASTLQGMPAFLVVDKGA